MAKRSIKITQSKTQNGHNAEFSNEFDPIVQVKQRNSKKGNRKIETIRVDRRNMTGFILLYDNNVRLL